MDFEAMEDAHYSAAMIKAVEDEITLFELKLATVNYIRDYFKDAYDNSDRLRIIIVELCERIMAIKNKPGEI